MLNDRCGNRIDSYVPDYVVFDLETTGTSAHTDAIIEISAIKVRERKVIDEFSFLVDPRRPISPSASAVNGITDDMVCGKPVISDIMPRFIDFIEDLPLVGHNIRSFDMKLINRDCMEIFGKVPDNDVIDTLYLSRKFVPGLAHHRLTDMADYYGINTNGAHRALADCKMNQLVFENLEKAQKKYEAGYTQKKICPGCGKKMVLRKSIYGIFWGCSAYPVCKKTEKFIREI